MTRRAHLISVAAFTLVLSACSNPFGPELWETSQESNLDDYDKSVLAFEDFLDEIETIQAVISKEPWAAVSYGNRPTACGRGGGFGFIRSSVYRENATEPLLTDLLEIKGALEKEGFLVDGVFADQSSSDMSEAESIHVVGDTGAWLLDLQPDDSGIVISGSSNCVDIEPRPVWDEMTRLGFSYVGPGELYLRPHERLPIRRGETPYVYPASTGTPTPTASATTTPHPSRTARPTRTPKPTDTRHPWSPTSTP